MFRWTSFSLCLLIVWLAGCSGLGLGAVGNTAVHLPPISLTWPPDAEAVDPEPVLQWEAFPEAVGYRVMVEAAGDTAVDQIVTDPLLPIMSSLSKGTSYTWTVQARDGNGRIIAEAQSTFFVKDDLAVVWPVNGESVDPRPILQWKSFPGAAQYHVIVVDDDAFPPVVALDQTTAENQMEVTPALTPGSFSWTVQAAAPSGKVLAELNSQFLVKATVMALEPVNFAQVSATPTLIWETFPNAVTYQIILIDDDAYPPVVVYDGEQTAVTWQAAEPLEPGSYSWTVWAKDAGGVTIAEAVNQFVVQD